MIRTATVLAFVAGTVGTLQAAVSPTVVTAPITGTPGVDFIIYDQSGPNLVVNNTLNTAPGLTGIMLGVAPAPGGNVELFANSEVPGFTLPQFQVLAPVSLQGTNAGHTVTLRSLNGVDWFGAVPDYSYGSSTLANEWFADFLAAYNYDGFLLGNGITQPAIDASKVTLWNGFLAAGGFQRLSDPNIAYANLDDLANTMSIGLEGSDAYIDTLLPGVVVGIFGRPDLVPLLPSPVQASEVVAVNIDGLPTQFLYNFSGTPTGLVTTDGTESYTTNFEVTAVVPEPASIGLLAMGAVALLRRRK